MCSVEPDWDYESPEFLNERIVRARKAHKCEECRKTINPGEEYEYTTGKYDGAFFVVKTCSVCLELRSRFRVSYLSGDLLHELHECFLATKDLNLGCLDDLSQQTVQVIADMLEKIWGDEELP
jgi:hypothetical protein